MLGFAEFSEFAWFAWSVILSWLLELFELKGLCGGAIGPEFASAVHGTSGIQSSGGAARHMQHFAFSVQARSLAS